MGKRLGVVCFVIACGACIIIDVGYIEWDVVFNEEMEEGGGIDSAREGEERFSIA